MVISGLMKIIIFSLLKFGGRGNRVLVFFLVNLGEYDGVATEIRFTGLVSQDY